jgi:non-ribosomal peptide synthetase component F
MSPHADDDEPDRPSTTPPVSGVAVGVAVREHVIGARIDDEPAHGCHSRRTDALPEPPDLPLRPDPAVTPAFRRRTAAIAPEQWQAITTRARAHDVVPAMALLTAYAETLSSWSGGGDLAVSLVRSDRRSGCPGCDDVTSVAVAYRPVEGENLLDAARRMGRRISSDGEPGAARLPVVFTDLLGYPAGAAFPVGVRRDASRPPAVWIDCRVAGADGGLTITWDAADGWFREGVLDAMFEAYAGLVGGFAGPAWSRPAPALLPAWQTAIRHGINATGADTADRPLHADFFAQAAAYPDRPALLGPGPTTLAYGQLAGLALRFGGRLRAAGLVPGDLAAVTVRRSPRRVVAMLGVLAAGGAYVPVGTDWPRARRHEVYRDAGVRFVVVDPDESDDPDAEDDAAWSVVPMAAESTIPALSGPVPIDPAAVAYVVYPPGRAYGVEIEHRGAVNTLDDLLARTGVGADDRVLAVSEPDADLTVFDVFAPLGAGGAIVLTEAGASPDEWIRAVRAHRATVWNSVPSRLAALLTADDTGRGAETIRVALVSGEPIGLDLPGRFAAAGGGRFIALGGAPEASIWSIAYEVIGVEADWQSIPYGYPLRNQRFRVVDARGRDCPDWVVGELWIGGLGVARGYRGDAPRPATRFVGDDGDRWFRTGELGRYWPDGTLERLGRREARTAPTGDGGGA